MLFRARRIETNSEIVQMLFALWRPSPAAGDRDRRVFDEVSAEAAEVLVTTVNKMRARWPPLGPRAAVRLAGTLDLRALSNGLSYDDLATYCVAIASQPSSSPERQTDQLALYFRFWYGEGVHDGAPVKAAARSKMISVIADVLPALIRGRGPTVTAETNRLALSMTVMLLFFRILDDARVLGMYDVSQQVVATDMIELMAEWTLKPLGIPPVCE